MSKAKSLFVKILVTIGLFSICTFIFDTIRLQTDAIDYLRNGEKVRAGMTLAQAKQIMGDYGYYERRNRSEIWTNLDRSAEKKYYLNYPAPLMAFTGTTIHFAPKTQLVIGMTCGEKAL